VTTKKYFQQTSSRTWANFWSF